MHRTHLYTSERGRRSAFLVLLVALVACGDDDAGRQAYVASGCPRCHLSSLEGTALGPPLTGIREFWDQKSLEDFLLRPESFRKADPRLNRIAEKYTSRMPAFEMPDSIRSRIAAYLLNAK